MDEQKIRELDSYYANRIKEKCHSGYEEEDHIKADAILCSVLKEMGFTEILEAYNEVYKYYC